MNTYCPSEEELIAAIRSGQLTKDLQTHLKTCAHCREIAEITEQLGSFSESLPVPRLTGASGLYQQAKRTQGDPFFRVLLPIWIMQLLLAVATIMAAFAGLFSGSRVLFRLTRWLHSLPGLADLTGIAALVVNIGTIAGIAIAVLLPLTVMGIWFRDILNEKPTAPRAGC